jgi:hypothetical protein
VIFIRFYPKGKKMENQIICPKCKQPIEISAIMKDEAKGAGSFSRSLQCECGERIPYWGISSQLQNQKTIGWKFQNWIRSLAHSRK